jgi:Fic family protein
MEGTISTLDKVLQYEIAKGKDDPATIETQLYREALTHAQESIESGQPLSQFLIKSLQKILLDGQPDKLPGLYKQEQNYIGDKLTKVIHFIPISPERIQEGMDRLFNYIETENHPVVIKAAIAHSEFEALHPFVDGNGRIGRMFITLMLWQAGLITSPHFYISGYFNKNKEQYKKELQNVHGNHDYTPWIEFFILAIEEQAKNNLETAISVNDLYGHAQNEFKTILNSIHSDEFLRAIFTHPIFDTNSLIENTNIKPATIRRFIRVLLENKVIKEIESASGRRVAIYSYEPLLEITRV